MRKFKIVWLDGKVEYVTGTDIANACNNAGIGGGAVRTIDYYEEVK